MILLFYLILYDQDIKKNKELRNVADDLLRLKSKYYISRKKRQQIFSEFYNKNKFSEQKN